MAAMTRVELFSSTPDWQTITRSCNYDLYSKVILFVIICLSVTSSSDGLRMADFMEGITWDLNSSAKLVERDTRGSSFTPSSIIVGRYSEKKAHAMQCTIGFSINTFNFKKFNPDVLSPQNNQHWTKIVNSLTYQKI